MEKKARVYIAGKISGTDDFRERFGLAQEKLEKAGYEVLNPAKLDLIMPPSATQEEYLSICYVMIEMADVVYFLDGWEKSHGATMEYQYCLRRNMNCIFEKDDSKINIFG